MNKVLRIFPLMGYYAFIFYLSSRPPSSFQPFQFADKVFHLIEYIPFGVLLAFALGGEKKKWMFILFALAFAAMDEIHQKFVPGRTPEVLDALADVVGAGIGGGGYYFLRRAVIGE